MSTFPPRFSAMGGGGLTTAPLVVSRPGPYAGQLSDQSEQKQVTSDPSNFTDRVDVQREGFKPDSFSASTGQQPSWECREGQAVSERVSVLPGSRDGE